MGPPQSRVAQLDSLRALAVGGVLYAHFVPDAHPLAALHLLPWGALGVQLFFVLSGFLITGILLACKTEVETGQQSVGFSLRQFYARRFLRIFPAYYLTLALTAATLWPVVRETLPWHLAYASNFYLVNLGDWRAPISPLWTLSVEEQFYLLWPPVVMLVPRRWLPRVVLGVVAAAPLFRMATWLAGAPDIWRVVLLPSCMDALGLGALLACLRSDPARDATRRALARSGLLAALPIYALLVQLGAARGGEPLDARIAEGTLSALACLWVVDAALRGFGGLAGRALDSGALRSVGRISYGIYLFHPFAPRLLDEIVGPAGLEPGGHAAIVAKVALTLSLAALSWRYVESPINARKERFPYRRAGIPIVPGRLGAARPGGSP
jgi:peptidoglycan/LPS O-acetylase OafA/YrhL